MTVSRRGQWSWDGDLKVTKSFAQCLDMLLRCAGGDGNLLLDVGPMPTGDIAPVQVELIRGMGDWLAKYGNSIYGTRGGPFKPARFGVSTRRGRTVYLHIEHWPTETLTIRNLPAKILRARVLTGGSVTFTQREEQIEISVPAADRQSLDTVVALELDRPAMDLEPVDAPLVRSLTTGAKATASNVFQGQAAYGADKTCDGDSETRWATDNGTTNAWLEVDLGKSQTVGRVVIEQAYPELKRVKKFAIEYWNDDQWKACYTGEDLGATLEATFVPVTAQRVRLNITEATDGPTIWEFQLYAPKASR
jgi:alpha-L-fucosidase